MSEIDLIRAESAGFVAAKRWRGGPEWHPRPHAHPFFEIIVVITGSERVEVDGDTYFGGTGEVVFYPPDTVHSEWQNGPTLLEFYCIEFDWPDYPGGFPYVIRDRQHRVLELSRWLNAESLPNYVGSDSYRQMITRMLAGELLRLVFSPSAEIVDVVRRYVRENLVDHLNLDMLAEACNLNKFHLVRQFRAITGLTPMEYVRSVRLDTAFRLITETELPLREIAPQVGFSDEYHLSRLLKHRYGRGARELRKSSFELRG
ncbi:MAG: AraC family transcriptional regulator [Candidatus Hydrogenedentes bacterium]|nr:AraC family transcriptional regulator [Candidatus Hydrogenedentota bacterium]